MATIKIRRGTKSQLDTLLGGTPLQSGEIGYTTDTNEVYAGDGSAHHLVGKVMVDVFTNRPTAGVSGRMFHASDTDATYVDDGSGWVDVSSGIGDLDDVPDGTTYARTRAAAVDSGYIVQLTDNSGANALTRTTIAGHIGDADKHREINDSASGTTDLWSASKIQDEVATVVSGIDPQESVLDRLDLTTAEPAAPTTGDRYINTATGDSSETTTAVTANNIYEWSGTAWVETVASEGMHTWVEDEDTAYIFNGTAWVKFGTTVTHNNLSGLNDGEYQHLTTTQVSGLHAESHTIASHSDTTATGTELETLTDGSAADSLHTHANLHAESHTVASHSDTTATGTELNTLTGGSDADSLHTHSTVASHTIASHSDTTATGTELETLTDGSNADSLHVHAVPANDHVAATVSDTTSIDMTISGQQISADLLVADGGTFV